MSTETVTKFVTLTLGLFLGLAAVMTASFHSDIAANWEARRCDPYVVPLSRFFKPANDPRTAEQFARDNWSFCQKEYIQDALRLASSEANSLAQDQKDLGEMLQTVTGFFTDVFYDVWNFCYDAYSAFMDQMKGATKLFHNMLIQLHSLVDRLQASVFSIAMGLMSAIVGFINTVQFVLMVAIIVVGILLAMMIILFFVLLPISGLIVTVSAIAAVVVVSVATAIAAADVGGCFVKDTAVILKDKRTRPIQDIRIGDVLSDGGVVTAIHQFRMATDLYLFRGIIVTGDHLMYEGKRRIPVKHHSDAFRIEQGLIDRILGKELWCLTTTTRTIPVYAAGKEPILFADWEEIPSDRTDLLEEWYYQVWYALNGKREPVSSTDGYESSNSVGRAEPATPPLPVVLDSTAAISPDCRVGRMTWWGGTEWIRADTIRIGDVLSNGVTVKGVTSLAREEVERAVLLPETDAIISSAVWMKQGEFWKPPAGFRICEPERMPGRWVHLYTTGGVIPLEGGYLLRDASDVGLEQLENLVHSVVIGAVYND